MGENKAYLSNEGQYTVFSFGETRLKFIAPYSLERYESVVLWDKGYLVVMAKYAPALQTKGYPARFHNSSLYRSG